MHTWLTSGITSYVDKCGRLVNRIKSLLFVLGFLNLNIENLVVRVFSVEKFVKRTWWNINYFAISKSQHKFVAYFMQHYQSRAFPKKGFNGTVVISVFFNSSWTSIYSSFNSLDIPLIFWAERIKLRIYSLESNELLIDHLI